MGLASQLSVYKSTIDKELKRNSTSKQKYNPALAQKFTFDRQKDNSNFNHLLFTARNEWNNCRLLLNTTIICNV